MKFFPIDAVRASVSQMQKTLILNSGDDKFYPKPERGAAWIAHHLGVVGVAGSNPVAPTLKGNPKGFPFFTTAEGGAIFRGRSLTLHNPPQAIHFGILIPCFNHRKTLGAVLRQIRAVQAKWAPNVAEILVVDDGSHPPIAPMTFPDEKISIVRLKKNMGKGAALKAGFKNLLERPGLNCIVTLDADLQHAPADIPCFLSAYQTKNADLVIGCRQFRESKMPWDRKLSNRLSSAIISLVTGKKIADSQCGFRLYSRRLLETIPLRENRFHLESEMVLHCCRNQYKIEFVSIPTIYNGEGSAIRRIADTFDFVRVVYRFLKDRLQKNV